MDSEIFDLLALGGIAVFSPISWAQLFIRSIETNTI